MRVGDHVELLIDTPNVSRGRRGTVVDVTRNGCHVAFSGGAGDSTDVLAFNRRDVWLIEHAARALDFHEWLHEWRARFGDRLPQPPVDRDACRRCGAPDGWSDVLRELQDKVAEYARLVDGLQLRVEPSGGNHPSTPEEIAARVAISRELLRTSPEIKSDLTVMIREEREGE